MAGQNNNNTVAHLDKKARRFCAYRERCTREVERKLAMEGASSEQTANIIEQLQQEGFIDNQRFAQLFVRGKLHNNRWGTVKIRATLKEYDIPEEMIRHAVSEIDRQEYLDILSTLINKKKQELQEKGKANIREKTAAYCIQKGFEPHLVWEVIGNQTA